MMCSRGSLPPGVGGQPLHDVLDHHHRRVDQHADGDRQAAQAHQVGRHAEIAHQDEGDQRRQRQHQRHGQRRAQVTEEQHQQHDHQHVASISAEETVPTAWVTSAPRS
jgi:hypothetical protein